MVALKRGCAAIYPYPVRGGGYGCSDGTSRTKRTESSLARYERGVDGVRREVLPLERSPRHAIASEASVNRRFTGSHAGRPNPVG